MNAYTNNVSVIDTATNKVVGTPITVGTDPLGVGIMPPTVCAPFSAFSAKLAIYLDQNPNLDAFGLLGSFTLGSTSDAIDPVTCHAPGRHL